MPHTLRPATLDDADFLPGVERSAALVFRSIEALGWLADGEPMAAERHRPPIAQSTCWVAVDDANRIHGFISAERQAEALHVHEVSVRHDSQGRGLGRQLVEAAMGHARSAGLRGVTLTTFAEVPWNAPFYERLGFRRIPLAALDRRLAEQLAAEYAQGFAPGSRCAMDWPVPR